MAKIKITEDNIKSVFGMLKKQNTGILTVQHFYPNSRKRNAVLRLIKPEIKPFHNEVLKSRKNTFNVVLIELDISRNFFRRFKDEMFIRVSNNNDDMYEYKAFLINIGDTIDFNNGTEIKIKTNHPTKRDEKSDLIVKFL